jgi:hypothetical protein
VTSRKPAAASASVDVPGAGQLHAVVSFDNALPHLLTDEDLGAACGALQRVVRPGGTLVASIRDYDTTGRPRTSYTVRHFILDGGARDWTVRERCTTYRALSRDASSS